MNIDRTAAVLTAIAVVACGVVFWLVGANLPGGYFKVEATKKLVAAELRDPSSAQFRNIRTKGVIICGEVNGKNGFGAYNGFTKFYASEKSVTIDPQNHEKLTPELPSDSEMFELSFRTYCD